MEAKEPESGMGKRLRHQEISCNLAFTIRQEPV